MSLMFCAQTVGKPVTAGAGGKPGGSPGSFQQLATADLAARYACPDLCN